ncbi:MAG: hypothetical protein IJ054_06450 [Lachnospiraceae bacterium]|nr:hypothetical protein [Lachnospiraceae bacterium]
MVSLEFVFDEEKVRMAGYTTDDLLEPMRKHAAKYGIREERYGYFTMDGENALAAIGMYVMDVSRNNIALLDYMTKFEMVVGNEIDDCIKDIKRWQSKRAVA